MCTKSLRMKSLAHTELMSGVDAGYV
jgi:hypothetical protein